MPDRSWLVPVITLLTIGVAGSAFADPLLDRCLARLDQARVRLGAADAAFTRARVQILDASVVLAVEEGRTIRSVRIARTSKASSARNNWNPTRDTWVDLPIIDKAYSYEKLSLFRFGERLEGTISASRADHSPRAPPVPAWLKPFVDAFKPAVEACLADRR